MVVDTAGGLDDNGGAAVERGELARVRAEQLQKRRRELSVVDGCRGGQWSAAIDDRRENARGIGWQVRHHQNRVRKIDRQPRREPDEGFHAPADAPTATTPFGVSLCRVLVSAIVR